VDRSGIGPFPSCRQERRHARMTPFPDLLY
jgi:hypothetical protein